MCVCVYVCAWCPLAIGCLLLSAATNHCTEGGDPVPGPPLRLPLPSRYSSLSKCYHLAKLVIYPQHNYSSRLSPIKHTLVPWRAVVAYRCCRLTWRPLEDIRITRLSPTLQVSHSDAVGAMTVLSFIVTRVSCHVYFEQLFDGAFWRLLLKYHVEASVDSCVKISVFQFVSCVCCHVHKTYVNAEEQRKKNTGSANRITQCCQLRECI